MSSLTVARAFLRKDWAETRSSRGALVIGAVGTLATLLLLSGLAGSAGAGAGAAESTRGGEEGMLAFLVIGIALFAVHDALVRELPRRVRRLQLEGTLEAVLSARADLPTVACSLTLNPLLRAIVRGGVLLLVGSLLFDLRLEVEGAPAALLLLAGAIPLFAAIGIAAAAVTIHWGRAEAVIALYGTLSALLGGVFFPAEALPSLLEPLAGFVPLAHALGPLRGALLGTLPAAETIGPILRLAVGGAILFPVSLLLLRAALRRALRDGALGPR